MSICTISRHAPHTTKFADPALTATGERRAIVALKGLRTLWFNTGTLCNIACANCYIESSPRNDALSYISPAEVAAYLDEASARGEPLEQVGFTGGEPFMNPGLLPMLADVLARPELSALVLTNAMQPMRRYAAGLARYAKRHRPPRDPREPRPLWPGPARPGARQGTFEKTLQGMGWLAREGFRVNVAGRRLWPRRRGGAARRLRRASSPTRGIPLDARDPVALMLFPGDGRPRRRAGDHRGLLGHPAQVARQRDVRLLPHGGEAQGVRPARRPRLHAAAPTTRSSNSAPRWPRPRSRSRSTIRTARASACWAARRAAA